MPFFDFHCHPCFKHLLSQQSDELSPWHDLNVKLSVGTLFGRELQIGVNAFFNDTINSQSNLKQMHAGSVLLAGVTLYAVENKLARGILGRKIASKGKINMLDPVKLTELAKGENYYEWTKKTMDALMQNSKPPLGSKAPAKARFKFINSINDFDAADTNTVHGILILEGIHNFCNNPFDNNAEADFDRNFQHFLDTYKVRIFAVNIPHLQASPFANHAYGMQFIEPALAYPLGNGFSDWGKRIIKKMYDNNILIDMKHMSFVSRTHLISERNRQGFTDKPLICTHAGLTGISMNQRYKYLLTRPVKTNTIVDNNPITVWKIKHLKPLVGDVPDSCFNRSSINLYDEEVLFILRSKGMIGISLDQRIIGFPTDNVAYSINETPYDEEFIAGNETSPFFNGVADPSQLPIFEIDDNTLTGDDAQLHGDNSFDFHYKYFLNQVFHILLVAKRSGINITEAAKQICIGSDFDGLINAISPCKNSTQYGEFKNKLRQILVNRPTFWRNLDIKKTDIDIDMLLNGLFFENAFTFLKKNFTAI